MKRESGELFPAIHELGRAVEAEFSGNGYYVLSQQLSELRELLGLDGKMSSSNAAPSFGLALGNARGLAEKELTGNNYYLAANKLDALDFLSSQFPDKPKAVVSAASPAISALNGAHRNFADLAAASKARVEEVAATLGIHLPTAHPHSAAQPETLADGELERRSSEPCYLGEMAPAGVSSKAVPAGDAVNPPPDLGSSSSEIYRPETSGENAGASAKKEAEEQTLRPAAPKDDRAAASAGQTLTGDEGTEPQVQKSLFTLWLDLLFGTKK